MGIAVLILFIGYFGFVVLSSDVLPRTTTAHHVNKQINEFKNGLPESFPINNNGPSISLNMITGLDQMRNPRLNKGMGFTLQERQALGIHGLLPAGLLSQEQQLKHCRKAIDSYEKDIDKYMYLIDLLDHNEKLFYYFLSENIQELMPYIYTPTVGEACQKYSQLYRRPRGLFITINDKGHIYDVLRNWPETDVRAIVVTDGERILGLGDQGANGMGIPVGKLALYTALGGIRPHQTLPITLDVGTGNESLLNDELYIGLKQKRATDNIYYDFIDEFMKAAVKRYGQNVLIQFEDFGKSNGFVLLDKYQNKYCTFNDDIQGTAAVVLAGLLTSLRIDQINKTKVSDFKVLILGAGQAGIGIAELCSKAMAKAGKISEDAARLKFWFAGRRGLNNENTPNLSAIQKKYAHKYKNIANLKDIIADLQPSVLIGAAGAKDAFTEEVIQEMMKYNARPIILALSNPTSEAECTAEQAYNYSEGKAIFASGSPFGTVTYGDKTFHPGQANNSFIFPGVALGIIASRMRHVSDDVFLLAAKALSDLVTDDDLKLGRIYPSIDRIQECSYRIAVEIVKDAYEKGTATAYPEPKDKNNFVKAHQYDYLYRSVLPPIYDWPKK